MAYFSQNITDPAGFLLSQSEISKTGRNASSPVESGFFDFESAMKAMSIRFGKDIAGIESTSVHSVIRGAAETKASERTGYETAEPVALNYQTVSLLLSKSDSKISMEISPDDLVLLLNKKAASELTGKVHCAEGASDALPLRFLEPLNLLKYQTKQRVIFMPASLLDAASRADSREIPVNLETSGLPAQSKYVGISELISLIKDYPDPVKMEVSIPLEKAAFAFDLRQLFQTENTSDKTIRGLLMFSGKQYMPNVIPHTIEGSLLPEPIVADDVRGFNLNSTLIDNINGSVTPPWREPSASIENAMDLLKSPLISHRSYLFGFGAVSGMPAVRKILNPAGDQTLDDPLRGITYYSSESDNADDLENPGRLDSRTLNSRLSDVPSGSKTIFNGTIQGSGADTTGESVLSYAKGETGISKTPAIEMTEPRLLPILDLNELRSGILYAARKNLTRVTLKLYPEGLGTVSIRLSWREDVLSASMKTNNVEAAKILSAGLTELRSGLENASLKVENLNVILDNGREADAFGSGIGARSQKPGAELEGDNHNGNRRFAGGPIAGSRRGNLNKIMHVSTHRGWIDLHA